MTLFFKAQEKIQESIQEYFVRVDSCMEQFHRGMRYQLKGEPTGDQPDKGETHRLESRADDMRRDIEMTLYGRALLPESRGDLLGMLEAMDSVPNAAETALNIIVTEQIEIPDEYRDAFVELLEVNMDEYRLLRKTAETLFENPRQTPYLVKEVDVKESTSDRIERRLIVDVFSSDMDKADKILLKDVIVAMGNISDRAENAADRMGIIAIKRRV